MASMLSHASGRTTVQQAANADRLSVQTAPASSAESAEELGRALTDGLKVLEADAPKDPSYWWG